MLGTYSGRSVARYVRGAYCRFWVRRKQRKARNMMPVTSMMGIRVEIRPDKEFEAC